MTVIGASFRNTGPGEIPFLQLRCEVSSRIGECRGSGRLCCICDHQVAGSGWPRSACVTFLICAIVGDASYLGRRVAVAALRRARRVLHRLSRSSRRSFCRACSLLAGASRPSRPAAPACVHLSLRLLLVPPLLRSGVIRGLAQTSAVPPDDRYDLALMSVRYLTKLAAVAVATVAALAPMSSAAATRPATADAQLAGAKSGTSVVIDPATGAILRFGAAKLRPAKSGTSVVIDPATGAILRFGAAKLRPAKSGTSVVIDPATGAILRFGAAKLRPAKSGTSVVIDPTTGAVLRVR